MGNNQGCKNPLNVCFNHEHKECPIDTYGTTKKMTTCALFSEAKVAKTPSKRGADCLACPTVDKNWNKHIDGYCKHGKQQDCLCMRPDLVDPILKKVWSKMPADLKNTRGTWYLPCLVDNYLKVSDLGTGDLKTECAGLEPFLEKELSTSDFTEIKTRLKCFNNISNGGTLSSIWEKHKIPIIISVAIIFFIILIIIIAAHSGKKKTTKKGKTIK